MPALLGAGAHKYTTMDTRVNGAPGFTAPGGWVGGGGGAVGALPSHYSTWGGGGGGGLGPTIFG